MPKGLETTNDTGKSQLRTCLFIMLLSKKRKENETDPKTENQRKSYQALEILETFFSYPNTKMFHRKETLHKHFLQALTVSQMYI